MCSAGVGKSRRMRGENRSTYAQMLSNRSEYKSNRFARWVQSATHMPEDQNAQRI